MHDRTHIIVRRTPGGCLVSIGGAKDEQLVSDPLNIGWWLIKRVTNEATADQCFRAFHADYKQLLEDGFSTYAGFVRDVAHSLVCRGK